MLGMFVRRSVKERFFYATVKRDLRRIRDCEGDDGANRNGIYVCLRQENSFSSGFLARGAREIFLILLGRTFAVDIALATRTSRYKTP